jgi:uncharacterized repeat protein (TIGR01451 family)
MTRLLLLFLFFLFASIASAVPSGDVEWGQPQVHYLHIGEFVERGDYIVEATDFFSNYVLITIYDKNWSRLAYNVTAAGDYVDFEEKINISVLEVHTSTGNTSRLNVPVDQWVKIKTWLGGKPRLTVVLELDRYEYRAGETIPLNVSVRNYGTAKIKNVKLSLLTNLTAEKREYDLYEIAAGNTSEGGNLSEIIRVRFKAPADIYNATYNITAVVTGEDVFGNHYRKEETVEFKVLGMLKVEAYKYVRARTYVGEKTYVTVTVVNNGSVSLKNVTLQDEAPPLLHPPPNYSLKWHFDLPAGARKSVSYPLTTTTPGSYILPPATVNWSFGGANYTVKTGTPRAVISGPRVKVTKIADRTSVSPNSTVNITLTVSNTGDLPAVVRIQDKIPEGVELVRGRLYRSMVVYQDETKNHTYTIKLVKKSTVTLPAALVSTTDLLQFYEEPGQLAYSRHNVRSKSNTVTLEMPPPVRKTFEEAIGKTVVTPTPTPFKVEAEQTPSTTPTLSPTEKAPSLRILTLIAVLLFTAKIKMKH